MSIYVIGDVHGNFDTLMALVSQLPKDAHIALTGDLIDRGPKSRQVVEWVMEKNVDCVMGNHEDLMVRWMGNFSYTDVWMANGGAATLESYGVWDSKCPIPQSFRDHRTWMANLPLMLAYPEVKNAKGRYLVVSHSSCSTVWNWSAEQRETHAEQFESAIMWDRNRPKNVPEIYNIFGHTPQPAGPRIRNSFANVDTGCFYVKKPGQYGTLTALQFPEMRVFYQKNLDVEPVQLEDG